jgi:bifunctional DNA primase/polymerase-like protein
MRANQTNGATLDDVIELFIKQEAEVVLLPINEREKGPRWAGWQTMSFARAQDPDYIRRLHSNANTGVLLGEASCGLCTIDCDTDAFLEAALEANPRLSRKTLCTRGERGGQIWFFATGKRPHKVHPLKVHKDSPLAVGLKNPKPDKAGLVEIGEWRAEGGQSVIRGIHPNGNPYTWLCSAAPITLDFNEIVWPSDVVIPWESARKGSAYTGSGTREDSLLKRAAAQLTVDRLWEHFGYSQRWTNPTHSPFREDKHPSFSVYDQGRRFKDHGCSEHRGDSFDFYQLATGQDAHAAFKEFVELAGLGDELKGDKEPRTDDEDTKAKETLARKLETQAHEVAKSIDAFYDQVKKEYVVKTKNHQNYQSHNEAQFKRDLRFHRLSSELIPRRFWSQLDIVLQELQEKKFVNYVGALAGKSCGFYSENGTRFLVTSEPHIIVPVKGSWPTLETFIVHLLCGATEPYGEDQLAVLYGWLKVAYCALRDRRLRPGQALAIAGPVESGKSLLQMIITQILGGRCAKAALFLQGRTDFNGELFEAEHLMLEDEAASTSHAARVALGTNIKEVAANRVQACHPKHRQIVNLSPWWRLTISMNDRPERLLILPPLVEDIADKIILLRASCHPMPMPTNTPEQEGHFWNTVVSELPAFLYYLVNDFTITQDWHSARFGVRAFHHPVLLTELEELSPAITLLGLIDQAEIWEVQSSVWEGTALELRALLNAHHKTSRDAATLLHWVNACGQYLNDLAKIRPARVKRLRTHTSTIYEIYREVEIG